MTYEELAQQIQALSQSVAQLHTRVADAPLQQPAMLTEVLGEFETSLDGLTAAQKQLRAQNDELIAARKALEAERQRYHSLFEFSSDGYLVTDAAGMIQESNQAAASLLHTTRDMLPGKPLADFVTEQERLSFGAGLEALSLGQVDAMRDWQVRVVEPGGSPFIIGLAVSAVRDSAGKTIGLLWLLQDIAERKRADQVLGKSEQLLERTLSSMRDAIFIIDTNAVEILDCNRAASQIFGYSRQEMLGRTTTFLHADEAALEEFRKRLYPEVEEKGLPFLLEFAMKRRDGTVFPTEHSVMQLENEQGKRIGWVSVVRDITERKREQEAEREQRLLAEALRDTAAALNSTLDLDEVLDRILENAERVLPHTTSNIMLVEHENVSVARSRGYAQRRLEDRVDGLSLPIEQLLCIRHTVETGQPVVVGDTRTFPGWRTLQQTQWIRSHVSAPIRIQGNVIGILNLDSESPGRITETDADHIQAFADQAAIAIENARLFQETRRRADEFAALYKTTHDLATTQVVGTLLQTTVERAAGLLGSGSASIFLHDSGRGDLEITATTGPELPIGARLQLGEGMAGRVAQTREPMIVDDYHTWEGRSPQFRNIPFAASVEVPMLCQGELIGVLAVNDLGTSRRKFTNADAHLLSLFATPAAAAVYNARLFEEVTKGRERLQALSWQLVGTQEMERRRLASELHDEIGQNLTGLKLTLEAVRCLPPEEAEANLAHTQTMINEMIGRVRDLALQLRPAMLDDLGLLPALAWHLDHYTDQTNLRVVFKHQGLEGRRFEHEIETAAYRIVQEALTNVARYAQVDEVAVRVWSNPDTLSIQVADQGVGFDLEAAYASNRTAGLAGMRERAALLGGQFTIESSPGHGTFLTAELPLSGRSERRPKP